MDNISQKSNTETSRVGKQVKTKAQILLGLPSRKLFFNKMLGCRGKLKNIDSLKKLKDLIQKSFS
jgi:hypothetical protein